MEKDSFTSRLEHVRKLRFLNARHVKSILFSTFLGALCLKFPKFTILTFPTTANAVLDTDKLKAPVVYVFGEHSFLSNTAALNKCSCECHSWFERNVFGGTERRSLDRSMLRVTCLRLLLSKGVSERISSFSNANTKETLVQKQRKLTSFQLFSRLNRKLHHGQARAAYPFHSEHASECLRFFLLAQR